MKCIKNGSKIKRVDDKTAQTMVVSSGWTYTSKDEWKKATRKTVTVNVDDESMKIAEEVPTKEHGLKAKERKKANKKKN